MKPLYVQTDELPETGEMMVVVPVISEQIAVRVLGYLKEMGIEGSIKEEGDLVRVHITCSVTRVHHLNFALYLVYEWTSNHADL